MTIVTSTAEDRAIAPVVESRIPAHDIDAEAAVISACLLDRGAYDKAAGVLSAEQFYSEAHRRIFEAAGGLAAEGKPVDVVQVGSRLRDTGRLTQVGGMHYLTEVLNSAPAVANVEAYAQTVAAKYQLRQLQHVCQRIAVQAYQPVGDIAEFVDRSEQAIYDVARGGSVRPRLTPVKDAIVAKFTQWHDRYNRIQNGEEDPGRISGLSTGLQALDDALGGLRDGGMTIVGARPGMGKSILGVEIAGAVARAHIDGTRPNISALFSLEMSTEEIAERIICSAADIDARKARAGVFDGRDWDRMTYAAVRLNDADQFLANDTPGLSLVQVRSMVRDAAADAARLGKRVRLVVVDYWQLMSGDTRAETREQAMGAVSRGLKHLAKEMKLHVIALAQLNRKVEDRTDKRPQLADIRETGAGEQDADNVVFIYRDEYYNKDSPDKGVAELLIAKQRNGPTGTVRVGFQADRTKFFNLPEVEEYR